MDFRYNPETVALVYKGMMGNKPVIIKVARRNIRNTICSGLNQLRYIVRFLLCFRCRLTIDINQFLNEHRELFLRQIDFNNEVSNLERMRHNFRNIDTVVVPDVYLSFTNNYANMIVMDYIYGDRLNDIQEKDKQHYVEIVMKFFIKSFLYDRFYHGDFHPGNIIFITKPTYKIGIIDYGIMNTLSDDEQEGLHNFTEVICKSNNYYKSLRVIIDNLIEPKQQYNNLTDDEKKTIYTKISDIVKDSFNNGGMISPNDLHSINRMLFFRKLTINASFCQFILALSILDSVVHKLSHNTHYIELLKRYGNEMFSIDILEM